MKEFLKDNKFTLILLTVLTAIFFFNKKKEKKTGSNKNGNKAIEKKDSIFTGGVKEIPAEYPLRPYSQVGEYSHKLGSRGPQILVLTNICDKLYGTKFLENTFEKLGRASDYTPEKEAAFLKYFGKTVFDEKDYLEITKQELSTKEYWWGRAI